VEDDAVGCIRHLFPRRHHHPAVVIPRQLLIRVVVDKVLVPKIRRAQREQIVERYDPPARLRTQRGIQGDERAVQQA